MKNIKYSILLLCTLILFSCTQKKTSNEQQDEAKATFDSLMQDTSDIFDNLQVVMHRFPTPGEMFGVIKEGGLQYYDNLINDYKKSDNYLNTKAQALNLGVYIADFAYIALFGRQNETVVYLEAIEDLGEKINISGAINESLVKRIKSNLGNVDSLVNFSDEAYLDMFSYCENNNMHPINALISSGAYIEGLYIALNSIDKYSENDPVLEQLAQQRFTFKNLLAYVSDYRSDKILTDIIIELEKINSIFNSLEVEKSVSKVSSSKTDNKLIIGGGKKYKFNKKQFKELKTVTNKIRNSITNLS